MNYHEILQLLKNAHSTEEIDGKQQEILILFPLCQTMVGYDQNHRAHQYDLWHHALHTVLNLPRNLDDDMLYLAALLHDIGKPDCRTETGANNSNAHYYGHPDKSTEIIRNEIIPTLSRSIILAEEDQQRLLYYVQHHDDWTRFSYEYMHRHLKLVSLQEFRNLMHLQIADAKAHKKLPIIENRIRICSHWLELTASKAI